MAKINLLPWRAERRKLRQREFYAALVLSAIVGVVLSAFILLYNSRQIAGQTERNQYLTNQIEEVKKQNQEIEALDRKKAQLLARKRVIEQLQANRSQMIHLLDSLVRTVPDGVVLTSVKQLGDILTLEGRSQSNARVSSYMRNLESSGWMTNPDLSIIEARDQDPKNSKFLVNGKGLPYVFILRVKLSAPKSNDSKAVESSAQKGTAEGAS